VSSELINQNKPNNKKWGLAGPDREGPWVNYIDSLPVRQTPLVDNKVIVNPGSSEVDLTNKTVNYELSQRFRLIRMHSKTIIFLGNPIWHARLVAW
jgi:hypothetical protein